MRTILLPSLLPLGTRGMTNNSVATVGVVANAGSAAAIQRMPVDAVYSLWAGRGCPVVLDGRGPDNEVIEVCGECGYRVRVASMGRCAGPVAQLDRASPSEGEGRTFESCRVRQSNHTLMPFYLMPKDGRDNTGITEAEGHPALPDSADSRRVAGRAWSGVPVVHRNH